METTVLGMNDILPFGKFKGLDISFILRNCHNGAEYLHWWHYNISNYPLSKSVRDNVSIAIANKYGLFEDDGNENDDLEREFTF